MNNPKMLVLETTQDCNLRCIMCPRHAPKLSEKKEQPPISDESFTKLTPILKTAEIIEFGGLGEPLVDPKLIERIQYIRKHNPSTSICLYTNGQLLNSSEKISQILPFINTLSISINGLSSYNKIMAPGTLEKLTQNLQLIAEYQKQAAKPVAMVCGYIVMRDNIIDISEFIIYVIKHGFHSVYFKDLWLPYPALVTQSIKNDLNLFEQAKSLISAAIEFGRARGIAVYCEESLLHAPAC